MAGLFDDFDTSFRGVVGRLTGALGDELDDHPGSVVRTLLEAFGREMATFYAILERAHDAGFVDTAEGDALDKVVSILGVQRARAGRLSGAIQFMRTTPAPQDIAIQAGFQVTGKGADGSPLPLFETVEDALLARGSTRASAAIQELPGDGDGDGDAALVGAGQLTIMPRPALGVEAVSNPEALRRSHADETDDHLRARARETLRRAQVGSVEAITAAVCAQGLERVEVVERVDGPPGIIDVLIGDEGFEADVRARARIDSAIRATKAAGVRVHVHYLKTVYIRPVAVIAPSDAKLDEVGFRRLSEAVARALCETVAASSRGQPIERRRLEAALLSCPGVADGRILEIEARTIEAGEPRPRPVAREHGVAIGQREQAAVDLDRWPPRIVRDRPPVRELDVVVDAPESARQAVRRVLERGVRAFADRAQRIAASAGSLHELIADALRAAVGGDPSGPRLLELFITDELGSTRIVATSDRVIDLIGDAQVVLGKIALTDAEGRGR